MEINSIEMTLTLPQNRKGKIVQQCQIVQQYPQQSSLDISKEIWN